MAIIIEKIDIDRTVFKKTSEEKKKLKELKRLYKLRIK
jgi:hypothetical protein